ncbi:hypothetical protein K3495_g9267 [Podosphaera aphanis]|nr:hypothetical protein K3495_g9267 [Podosphaera aphanis]
MVGLHLVVYESPYSADSVFADCHHSSILKRRRASDQSLDVGDKRQKIGLPTSPLSSLRLAAFLAHASDCAIQQPLSPELDQKAYSHSAQSDIESGHVNNPSRTSDNSGYVSDPNLYMKILSLPILDSLSIQILTALAQGPHDQTIAMVTLSDSELGHRYATLKSLFDQVKKIYSQQETFLSADTLGIKEPEHRETIRRTNLATFASSVFYGHSIRFLDLNDSFLSIFTAEGDTLKKETGELFLNLKTQMYLSAVSQGQQGMSQEDILEGFFPHGVYQLLENLHPGLPLSQSEAEFVASFSARRESLANAPFDFESIQILSEKYSWEDFLKRLGSYLSNEPFLACYLKRHTLNVPISLSRHHSLNELSLNEMPLPTEDNLRIQAELAAKATLESLGLGCTQKSEQSGVLHEKDTVSNKLLMISEIFSQPQQNSEPYQLDYNTVSLPKDQTAPTQVLYERARQAAVARASPTNSRRPGLPSQRRPWSDEEERALMAGLDQVRGPYWSQILALYGPRGTINQVLKDRNQVQLKDKARNLKLFFLKRGIEVPYYLKTVTGELRTRAPSQATRREAEELARISSEEEKIRMSGIMVLAGGLHEKELAAMSNQDSDSNDEIAETEINSSEKLLPWHEINS